MSDRILTEQQQTAVDTRGVSVVLSSGAGCGKTSVLTDRFVSHLDRDKCEVSQLAAITFTDKAAREMRKRIREAIQQKIKGGVDQDKWREHLRNLETATISTIHSFCGQLLRRFALPAGLDPTFEIMEESIAPNLRENVVRETLYDLLTTKSNASESLRELVSWYGWSSIRKTIDGLVRERDSSHWAEWLKQSPAEIADRWRATGQAAINEELQRQNESGPVVEVLRLLSTISAPNEKFAVNAATIRTEWQNLPNVKNAGPVLENLRSAAMVQGVVKKSEWSDSAVYPAVRDAFSALRNLIDKTLAPLCAIPEKLDSAAEFGQRFIRVALECVNNYETEKQRRGYVDFQDLLMLARNLLRDDADVRRECQKSYQFILVDELQDTDHVQMELLDLLCGNKRTTGKLFAVGDAKQSIYRFRGAEVEEFTNLRDAMPEKGQQSLTYNFRSQPAILHFVNAVLENDMPDYEPLRAKVPQLNAGPNVEFLWSDAVPKNVTASRKIEARRIAQTIATMIVDKEQLVIQRDKNGEPALRGVQPRDVVLLFRAMTNVSIYEEALRNAGLDYYLVGGRAFFAQQEIYDVLNLLRVLENPHDLLSLAGVLRSPFGCVSDEGLYVLAHHPSGLWKGLHDPAIVSRLPSHDRGPVARIGPWLLKWRRDKDRVPIAGLLNRVLADSGYDAALRFETMADRKLANLWKLIDLARTFDSAGGFILADFVDRLSELVETPPREEQAATQPEESNVIRIMSIHQAKGLEFPVVFLPDLNAKPNAPRVAGAVWDAGLGCIANPPSDEDPPPFSDWPCKLWGNKEKDAERAEALRVFYVACTRAKDYLVLSASWEEKHKAQNPATEVLSSHFDLNSGACIADGVPLDERPQIRVDRPDEPVRPLLTGVTNLPPAPLTAADARRVQPISS